ncbi:MAG: hypothetical protein KKF44_03855 [Nanoarchaeota archaeon]|nr:hypothetical protein [Nanoarchaeota archaeon]
MIGTEAIMLSTDFNEFSTDSTPTSASCTCDFACIHNLMDLTEKALKWGE